MKTLRFLLFAALISSGCGITITPPASPGGPPLAQPEVPATPPEIPAVSRVALTILDKDRKTVPGLECSLTPDESIPAICVIEGVQTFYDIPSTRIGWGGTLRAYADGWKSVERRVIIGTDGSLHDENDKPFEVILEPNVKLPRLVTVGQYFRLETGERFTWIGASQFNLLNRFRNGEDITPILTQLRDLRFNAVRVFTVYDICPTGAGCQAIGRSAPTPDLYAAIPYFAAKLASYGLYAELVGFTGPYGLIPTDEAKVQHWESLMAASQGLPNITLELVNEYDHPANVGIPISRLRRPTGNISSHGSGTQDQEPLKPFWDYATYRPGSGNEWMRKVAHNGMEDVADKYNIVTVANETTRFPDNDGNAQHAFDAAAGAALLSAGAVYHSVEGKSSVPWTGVSLEAAKAWAQGANSVPLHCQGQGYRRTDDPTFLRTYSRGADPACTVRIQR